MYRRVNSDRFMVLTTLGIVIVMGIFTWVMYGMAQQVFTMTDVMVELNGSFQTMTKDIHQMGSNMEIMTSNINDMNGNLVSMNGSMAAMNTNIDGMTSDISTMAESVPSMTVRHQSFWVQRLFKLREYLAHLVGFIMRRTCGVASAESRVFCI